jgi:hypothetical protein
VSKREARELAAQLLGDLRVLGYAALVSRFSSGEPEVRELAEQRIWCELSGLWDDRSKGHLRVVVTAGVDKWFMPPSQSFIIAPDGSFIGE